MHTTSRVIIGAAAAAVLGFGTWTPVHADPAKAKGAFPVTVTCDNGHTYSAVSNGNGNYTPAHDLDSTATLIPLSFGEATFTVYDANGVVVDSGTDPGTAKRGASVHNKNGTLHCTYTGGATFPDGSSFVVTGSVTGFITH